MGRIQHASPLETLYDVSSKCSTSPLMVRNTFLEVMDMDMEAPPAGQLTRARTAPEHPGSGTSSSSSSTWTPSCLRHVSTPDVDSESSCSRSSSSAAAAAAAEEEEQGPQLLLPFLQRSSHRTPSATSLSSASSSQELSTSDDEPELRIKNTFYEVVVPSRSFPKRSKSMPLYDLAKEVEDEDEEEVNSSSQETEEADDETEVSSQTFPWATPMGDDSPRLRENSAFGSAFFGQSQVLAGSVAQFGALQPSFVPAAAAPWAMVPVAYAPAAALAQVLPQALPQQPQAEVPEQQEQQQDQQRHSETEEEQEEQEAEEEQQPQSQRAPRQQASSEKKQVAVQRQEAKEIADGKRRQKTPAASENRALDLITDACRAARDHQHSAVWQLARKDSTSSALVQKAIDVVAEESRIAYQSGDKQAIDDSKFTIDALMAGMHGHVRTAIEHPHANYVLQRAAEVLPIEHLSFIATELKGKAVWASRHRFGCRTVLRLVARCQAEGWVGRAVSQLVDEMLPHAYDLAGDQFGNYVMQEVLEHGFAHQRHAIADALLRGGLGSMAGTQQGSRVVEKALRFCDAADEQAIADTLLGDRTIMKRLAASEYGCLVLKPLLRSEKHGRRSALVLRPLVTELRKTRQGRRLLGPVLGHTQSSWD